MGAKNQRRCVGCNASKNKNELLRVCNSKDGYKLDIVGNIDGRGAYVCKDALCVKNVIKKKRLNGSFKTNVPAYVYDLLKELFLKGG